MFCDPKLAVHYLKLSSQFASKNLSDSTTMASKIKIKKKQVVLTNK